MSRIAIDFDGVIFDKSTGKVGIDAQERVNGYIEEGHEVTVFTNRPDYDYSSVRAILDANGILYHRIICGKPSYDVFIDDRAVRFDGWDKEYL